MRESTVNPGRIQGRNGRMPHGGQGLRDKERIHLPPQPPGDSAKHNTAHETPNGDNLPKAQVSMSHAGAHVPPHPALLGTEKAPSHGAFWNPVSSSPPR